MQGENEASFIRFDLLQKKDGTTFGGLSLVVKISFDC
jgi:hypothetical protein